MKALVFIKRLWVAFIFVFSASLGFAEPGYHDVNTGNGLYEKGDFSQALFYYKKAAEDNPSSPAIDYNMGTDHYQKREYNQAVECLNRALLTDDEKLLPKVRYNLGNALYKQGIAYEFDDLKKAIKSLEEALPHYEKAIVVLPKDEDVKNNYDFVKEELERLKKKQKDNNSNQNQSSNNNSNNSSNNQSSQNNSSNSSQSPQGEQGNSGQPPPPSGGNQDDQGQQGQPPPSGGSQGDQGEQGQPPPSGGNQDDQGGEGQEPPPSGGGQGDQGGQGQQGQPSPSGGNQNNDASGQGGQGPILSQKEANMLLDDFEQNDQPKGLLNFIRKSRDEKPVDKDW